MAFENVLPPVREAMQALAHHPGLILASASSDNVAAYLRAHGADASQADMVAASPLSERSVAPKITAVAGAPTVVLIMGEIGWEVTAQGVLDTLNAAGGADLDIRINSPGGSAFEGFAVFNMLARYPGRKSVTVESVAASAASFIAMAGDDIVMAPASFLMIHNSMGMTMGDQQAHAATIAVLDRIDATMAGIYAKRTGGTAEAMRALMNAETWFTADEAVAQGFADRVEEPVLQPDAAARTTPRAAALIKAFAHAPAAVLAMAVQPSPPDVTTVVEEPAPVVPPVPAQPQQVPTAPPASVPPVPPAPASPPSPTPAVPDPKETVMPATLAELQAIAARAKLSSDWIVAQMVAKATPQAATEAAWEAVTAATVTCLVESMDYSAAALVAQWPSHFSVADANRLGRTSTHPAYQQSIAERAYGGRGGNRPEGQGDGWLFRGHGGMQTTFRSNYVALAKAIGWSQSVELLPAYLTTIAGACDSAAVFWRQAGCNTLLDAGNITAARVRVNGGTIGLAAVQARYVTLCRIVGLSSPAVAPAAPALGTSGSDALNDAELLRVQAGQGGARSIAYDS